MAQLYKKHMKSDRSLALWSAVLATLLVAVPTTLLANPPVVRPDPAGDVRILRTDQAEGDPFDSQAHRLPDILETRLGKFQPESPATNLFNGDWSSNGGFVRLDVVLNGLINPPGLVGLSDDPVYSPYMYGPNPVFGFIELDVDGNVDTGGELDFPQLRYLGNVSRLGGLPGVIQYSNRIAISQADFDVNVLSAPFVDRAGEEFHLSLVGDEINSITIKREKCGGNPALFEAGETWQLTGRWLHRAHSYEPFSLKCFAAEGRYMPMSVLQFRHSTYSNRTTISLVFPLTNANCAQMQSPVPPTQPNNGCPGDQFSIEEALEDLQFSASNPDPFQMTFPEFALISDWAVQSPVSALNPAQWRINACLGSAYAELQSGNARFVWTDMYPNVVNGDFNGDGLVTIADIVAFETFLHAHDGDPDYDDDGECFNQSIKLTAFSRNFCLFDANYDGYVDYNDVVRLGDMNWDGVVSCADISDFTIGLLDPDAYTAAHPGKSPEWHGDMDGNGVLDGRDIQLFVNYLMNQP